MPDAVFPDNTVLCNFAAVDRLDLLEGWLRGRGRWTEAVAHEAQRSADHLPALVDVVRRGWLGEAVVVDLPKAVAAVEHLRRDVFGGTIDRPLQHLGEAQTCYLLQQNQAWAGAWWVSDDHDSLDYARFVGITTRETIDIVCGVFADGDLTASAGLELMRDMANAGRALRLPRSSSDLTS
ncbi:hypothetical protein [Lapillicoccus sp.]|uniref:hypothetical protein n=1 Tax=Lapillicoccus sp. TaxID=1909287 RepID=UPI0025F05A9C|nr:hypothetical protein [Lapillicoccus sp.]